MSPRRPRQTPSALAGVRQPAAGASGVGRDANSEIGDPDDRTDRELESLKVSERYAARLARDLARARQEVRDLRGRVDGHHEERVRDVRREAGLRLLLVEATLARTNDRIGAFLQLLGGFLVAGASLSFVARPMSGLMFWIGVILALLGFFMPLAQNRALAVPQTPPDPGRDTNPAP